MHDLESPGHTQRANSSGNFKYMEIDGEEPVKTGTGMSSRTAQFQKLTWLEKSVVLLCSGLLFGAVVVMLLYEPPTEPLGSAWSSKAKPFSITNPVDLGFAAMERPDSSKPGPIFGELLNRSIPLPTNSWYQNFLLGTTNHEQTNKVFQVPYILDTAGYVPGVRAHPAHVQGDDTKVMMTFELENGLSLGAVEDFQAQHKVRPQLKVGDVPAVSKLAIELEWVTNTDPTEEEMKELQKKQRAGEDDATAHDFHSGPYMRSPIVRGSPYLSMIYGDATPRVFVQREMNKEIVIDGVESADGGKTLECGTEFGNFSATPVLVKSDLKLQFDTSDMTWLVFISEPMEFICSSGAGAQSTAAPLAPGVVGPAKSPSDQPYFELRAVQPVHRGMVRIALVNNCSMGQNPIYCGTDNLGVPHNRSAYEALLRTHKDLYPTAKADVQFTFPVSSTVEEELRLDFLWKPSSMSELAEYQSEDGEDPPEAARGQRDTPDVEVLMFALPHHQERVRAIIGSSNRILLEQEGCTPTIHGNACPVLGHTWSMVEHLHPISFHANRPVRKEMLHAVQSAAKADLSYAIPANYMVGAGDTYFSGKMLAKLGRILIVAEEVGAVEDTAAPEFQAALNRLRSGVEVWLNGTAQSPFLYDRSWGGMIMCGCNYVFENGVGRCANKMPDCPALTYQGQNFGAGFYNDHHYHFGYHIYAAAILCHYDHDWARQYYDHVLMLVRDIANPSDNDPFFPTFRHKDWFLGFSWASGVVTIEGEAYPNGRNQESVSEAISAYEAVALLGDVLTTVFRGNNTNSTSSDDNDDNEREISTPVTSKEIELHDSAVFIRDMGRLLMCTEIRSARTYWQVQAPGTEGVSRIYPTVYAPKIVGMIWSTLVQEQTWFGNEAWKSYGIQLIPLTAAAELRDNVQWVEEMLPSFQDTCNATEACASEGFGITVLTSMASVDRWEEAWAGVAALPSEVWEKAGGNGHSLSNTLWYIATRPSMSEVKPYR